MATKKLVQSTESLVRHFVRETAIAVAKIGAAHPYRGADPDAYRDQKARTAISFVDLFPGDVKRGTFVDAVQASAGYSRNAVFKPVSNEGLALIDIELVKAAGVYEMLTAQQEALF